MRAHFLSATALVAAGLFFVPFVAQAILYAPGETLNPACAPTDPGCGVQGGGTVGSGTTGQIPYYASSGTVLTATSSLVLNGAATPLGAELITNGSFDSGSSGWVLGTDAQFDIGFGTNRLISQYNGGDPSVSTTFETVAGHTYLLTFDVAVANAPMTFSLANNTLDYNVGPFFDGPVASYAVAFKTNFTGTETVTFDDWNFIVGDQWTLDNVSIKEISEHAALKVIGPDGRTLLSLGEDAQGNTSLGNSALSANTTGGSNTAIGFETLRANTTGKNNTANGYQSLRSNTIGSSNTATGLNTLFFNVSGSDNTAAGFQAMLHNTSGNNNTAHGANALFSNTVGSSNTAVGNLALDANTIGSGNTGIGAQALSQNTSGNNNTAVGFATLILNTTGDNNTATGKGSLNNNSTGSDNTAYGFGSLSSNSTGDQNTAIGRSAMDSNSTGRANTATGFKALFNTSTGSFNTALGEGAMQLNETGSDNTALGEETFFSNVSGERNTIVGEFALGSSDIGSDNTVSGYWAMQNNTNASSSVAIGSLAGSGTDLYSNLGGTYVGFRSGFSSGDNSDYNTFLGFNSGYNVTTGSNNIWIGTATSSPGIANLTTGSQNILIGSNISLPSATDSGQLNVGNIIFGTGNTGTGSTVSTGFIGIGNPAPAQRLDVAGTIRQTGCLNSSLSANGSGDIICTSDANLKQNITPFTSGLSAITGITPQYFEYKGESFTHAGFIAQNVETVLPDAVSRQNNGYLGLDTTAILAASVNAIKEVNAKVDALAIGAAVNTSASVGTVNSLASSLFTSIIGEFNTALGIVWDKGLLKVANIVTDTFTAKTISTTELTADKLTANEICTGDVCITKDQLSALLSRNQLTATQPPTMTTSTSTEVASTTEPAPEIAPAVTPAATTTEPALESTPAPASSTTPVISESTTTPPTQNLFDVQLQIGGPAAARSQTVQRVSPPPSPLTFTRFLAVGSSGADVKLLQSLLVQKKFLTLPAGEPYGYYGELTRLAVMKYQASVGLEPVGTVGAQTRVKLNAESAR